MTRTPLLRLQDILQAIEAAYRHAEGMTRAALEADEARYAACQFRILVVAEAAKFLPEDLRARHPKVNWTELIRMGDRLKHQYFRVESDIVWETIQLDLPILHAAVTRMAEEEGMALAETTA